MSIKFMATGIAGVAFMLGGCTSTESGSALLTPEEAARQVFATKADDTVYPNLLAALEDGKVYARTVTTIGLDEDYSGVGTTYALTKDDFSVEITDSGDRTIVFSIDGTEYTLTDADEVIEFGDALYWEIEGVNFYLNIYPVRNDVDGVYGGGGRYMQAFGYFLDSDFDDDEGTGGFAVVGAETRDSELDDRGDAVAVYNGQARFEIREQGVNWSDYNARARADITMTADFGADSISGEGELFEIRAREGSDVFFEEDPDAGIIFEETSIQGNAFAGDISPDGAMVAYDADLAALYGATTYSGAFYGPNGQQLGGIASGSATLGEGEDEGFYLMYGTFEAFEED